MIPVSAAIVLGVSGSGKTTLARAIAATWPASFLDADDFHSVTARSRMASGQPLSDRLRLPWVKRIATALQRRVGGGERVALAFSGLRRRHREMLRQTGVPIRFVFLHGHAEVIAERMQRRSGHFMPVSLLDSQFAALEDPRAETDVSTLSVLLPPELQLQKALELLRGLPCRVEPPAFHPRP